MKRSPHFSIPLVLGLLLAAPLAAQAQPRQPQPRQPQQRLPAPTDAPQRHAVPSRPIEAPSLDQAIYSLGTFLSECGDEFEIAVNLVNGAPQLVLLDETDAPVEIEVDRSTGALSLANGQNVNVYQPYVEGGSNTMQWRSKHRKRPSRRGEEKKCYPFGKKKNKRW